MSDDLGRPMGTDKCAYCNKVQEGTWVDDDTFCCTECMDEFNDNGPWDDEYEREEV